MTGAGGPSWNGGRGSTLGAPPSFVDTLTVYQNLGWTQNEGGSHQITWGARLDWTVVERAVLIGEVAGEGRSASSVQAALRTVLLPGVLETDISVTKSGVGTAASDTWITVGLPFMTPLLY